ncbi:hypothetical protein [Rufibacter quisquiliarum]|uniref:Lipocalin-like domain-containing protein n=1 Tax=Rufibacter quisquiliarum TaxID=1549639 RepID=A0A839GPK0_9BACT|nr:hypothetical protein [Rufibacter quisquiliarum]MBA9076816.1 hypothetical protein [Rufibacter quisquiliarum]
MKKLSLLCLFMLGLMAFQCRTGAALPDAVYGQTWLYSYEEDSADVRTYRPNTFQFPPSRGRTGFMLKQDGTFIHYGIAPADGLEEQPGTWKATSKNQIQVTFSDTSRQPAKLEIISAAPTVLKVRRLTPEEN